VVGAAFAVAVASAPLGAVAGTQETSGGVTFSGVGNKTLPAFRVTRPSTLFWHAAGGQFELSSALDPGDAASSRTRGWTYLAPGRYQYTVTTQGAWSFRVQSGTVKPAHAAGGFLRYAGEGSAQLPPIRVGHRVTLFWSSPHGGIFQLTSTTGGTVTAQQQTSGRVLLVKGSYRYGVNATGPWTIRWRP
jgi:hypothetical protein